MRLIALALLLSACGSGSLDLNVNQKSESDDGDDSAPEGDVVSDEKPSDNAPPVVDDPKPDEPKRLVLKDVSGVKIGFVMSDKPSEVEIQSLFGTTKERVSVEWNEDGFVAPKSQPRCFIVTGQDCEWEKCVLSSGADFGVFGGQLYLTSDSEKVSASGGLTASMFDGERGETCEMGEPVEMPAGVTEMPIANLKVFTPPFSVGD